MRDVFEELQAFFSSQVSFAPQVNLHEGGWALFRITRFLRGCSSPGSSVSSKSSMMSLSSSSTQGKVQHPAPAENQLVSETSSHCFNTSDDWFWSHWMSDIMGGSVASSEISTNTV